jgi:hypothetical protein
VIADGYSQVVGLVVDDACVYFFSKVPDPVFGGIHPSLRVYPKR